MLHVDFKLLQIFLDQLSLQPKSFDPFPEGLSELFFRHAANLGDTAYKYHRELAVLAKNQKTG